LKVISLSNLIFIIIDECIKVRKFKENVRTNNNHSQAQHNEQDYTYVGFEVFPAVLINGHVFWDITPRSPLKVNRSSGETFLLAASCWLFAWLFTDPEDGDDMFFRNLGRLCMDKTALCHRIRGSSEVPMYLVLHISLFLVNKKCKTISVTGREGP
jgi:hypothetical protein